ncbi:hypothetical protein [Pseudoxanthomonas sp. GM95]|uniref:hypothetical protein n=1 Tax=Pseudoxanthomonas sp. GM95 TaxID=1881043 RepID=UPI000B827D16|nr:hypothetical protein [Pseudoxanthomonas sp. GM95]
MSISQLNGGRTRRFRDILFSAPAMFAFSCLLIFSRRVDALTNAQFWAEDGVIWYRQAYELGVASLLHSQNGYFQTVSRMTALLSLNVPLEYAPLFFNLVALFFNALPVLLINGARGVELLADRRVRLLLSFLYVAHPYSGEVHVNVTNIHWHLAVAALLVIFFNDWRGSFRKISDLFLVVLCGLSGTFALFLAPIAVWRHWMSRSRRSLALAALMSLCAVLQLFFILATPETRTAAPNGATFELFWKIVGGQVVLGGLLGDMWLRVANRSWWSASWIPSCVVSVVAVLLMARAWFKGGPRIMMVVALGGMVFGAALLSPQISSAEPQWPIFSRSTAGGRYAFLPILAMYVCILWQVFHEGRRPVRVVASAMLACVLFVAIPHSWVLPPYQDFEFSRSAQRFEAARAGSVIQIPINPSGWVLSLKKRQD